MGSGPGTTRRRVAAWSVVLALASAAVSLVPGFDVLSFYFCLPTGLLVAMAAGGTAVTITSTARRNGEAMAIAWVRSAVAAGVYLAVLLSVSLVFTLVNGPCDTAYGLLFYLAGPVASAACGLAAGAAAGSTVPGRAAPHLVFHAVFVGSFVPDAWYLYHEPAVFFFNPFLGYYPGPIYDDLITVSGAYAAFRAMCLAAASSVALASFAVLDGRFKLRRRPRALPASLSLVVGALAGILWWLGPQLGFSVNRDRVEQVLSSVVKDRYCNMRFDPRVAPAQAARLLRDCGFRYRQAARFFGVEADKPIHVYLYWDADQKAGLMGARKVEVSKPWSNEIHLVVPVPGDPVLAHEIAHVVAGRLARNPLHVPLKMGIAPDMAVVEGLAVAAAFAGHGPSPHEWSLAMVLGGVAPRLSEILGPWGFLTGMAGRSYRVVGSFTRYLADELGTGFVRALASGEDLGEAAGAPLAVLEAGWKDYLAVSASSTVDRALVERAAGRFAGPGVLGRRCPVDTARAAAVAVRALEGGDTPRAESGLRKLLAMDPSSRWAVRMSALAGALGGDGQRVRRMAGLLASPADGRREPSPVDLAAAADSMVILGTCNGGVAPLEAMAMYLDAFTGTSPWDAWGRSLAIRLRSFWWDPVASCGLARVMAGIDAFPADTLLQALAVEPDGASLHYLAGKALVGEGLYDAALDHLLASLDLGLPGPALTAQAFMAAGEAAYWAGEPGLARDLLRKAGMHYQGDRMVVREYLDRLSGDATMNRELEGGKEPLPCSSRR